MLRVGLDAYIVSLDPGLGYDPFIWEIESATTATLLTYADTKEVTLVPEIAAALPDISEDGKTYTFRIRQGFALSPPSGEAVTALMMKKVFERRWTRSSSPREPTS